MTFHQSDQPWGGGALSYLKVEGNLPGIEHIILTISDHKGSLFMPNSILLAPPFLQKKNLIVSITFSFRNNLAQSWSNCSAKSVIWPFASTLYQFCPWSSIFSILLTPFLLFLDLFDPLVLQNLRSCPFCHHTLDLPTKNLMRYPRGGQPMVLVRWVPGNAQVSLCRIYCRTSTSWPFDIIRVHLGDYSWSFWQWQWQWQSIWTVFL